MIAGNVPKHLVTSARTGFLSGMRRRQYPWQQITATLNMDASSQQLVDLGAAPMPTNSRSGLTVQDFIEKEIEVEPEDWDITVFISQNALDDDQTGSLERKVRSAGDNFQKHINSRVFTVLNAGDSADEGLAYDGQHFFDSDHVDEGAEYQTNQDNEAADAISLDNFNTAWVAAQQFRDDQGEFTQFIYDLLVTHPTNKVVAENIAGNIQAMDTSSREMNPYAGELKAPVFSPYLDTTAWYIVASSEEHKPLILGMRKEPHLQHAWFDPTAPDGGRYYFKFFARYKVVYGDWRLAYQGNT